MKNIRKQEETPLLVATDTSVQRDRHQCLSRQTPVSDATDACACQSPSATVRRCQCCLRQLPLSAFYTRTDHRTPDSYCKECRKEANRLRRKSKACLPEETDTPPRYPVITRIEDPEVRMVLILHALHAVHESAARKCRKQHENEFLHEELLNPIPGIPHP